MGHGVVALAVLITLAAALSEMAWLVVMYEHTGEKDGGAVMYEHAGEMGALQSRSAGLQIEIGSPFVCGPDTHIWLLLPVSQNHRASGSYTVHCGPHGWSPPSCGGIQGYM